MTDPFAAPGYTPVESKSRLTSKTYWFATVLVTVGTTIAASAEFQALIASAFAANPALGGVVVVAVGAIIAALREVTSAPVKPIGGEGAK